MNIWPEAMVTAHRKLSRQATGWLEQVLPPRVARLRDECGTERFTTGMAIGGDQLFGLKVMEAGAPLRAAIPYPSQPLDGVDGRPGQRWTVKQQGLWTRLNIYAEATGGAEHVFATDPRSPGERVRMLHKRNDWMLQRSTVVLALWEPVRQGRINNVGGTHDCIEKAVGAGMPVILFDLCAFTVTMPTPETWAVRLGRPALAVARQLW